MEARDAKRIVTEQDIKNVKVGFIDVDGVMRGKYLSREKFLGILDHGFAFCDVVLGRDSNDQLYENIGTDFTGWPTGYGDAQIRILPVVMFAYEGVRHGPLSSSGPVAKIRSQ